MKRFFIISLIYLAVAVAIVMIFRENGVEVLIGAWTKTLVNVSVVGKIAVTLTLVGVVLAILTKVQSMRFTILTMVVAFVGSLIFQSGFTLIKTSMPYITPFFADPDLAVVDRALHGGVDPWVWTHQIAEYLPMEWVMPFYLSVWAWPAICLPIIVAATDSDAERVKRTMTMYALAWILVGNVIALSGLSVGPVFYDRLMGTTEFAGLEQALGQVDLGKIGLIQENLWTVYVDNGQTMGSGISAFPSVHVSVAMVTMFYMFERSKLLAPFAIAFTAIIMFLSVYTGYHYALDGYASMIVMTAAWFWLRRAKPARQDQPENNAQPMAQPA